jgi:hypothetical protein
MGIGNLGIIQDYLSLRPANNRSILDSMDPPPPASGLHPEDAQQAGFHKLIIQLGYIIFKGFSSQLGGINIVIMPTVLAVPAQFCGIILKAPTGLSGQFGWRVFKSPLRKGRWGSRAVACAFTKRTGSMGSVIRSVNRTY